MDYSDLETLMTRVRPTMEQLVKAATREAKERGWVVNTVPDDSAVVVRFAADPLFGRCPACGEGWSTDPPRLLDEHGAAVEIFSPCPAGCGNTEGGWIVSEARSVVTFDQLDDLIDRFATRWEGALADRREELLIWRESLHNEFKRLIAERDPKVRERLGWDDDKSYGSWVDPVNCRLVTWVIDPVLNDKPVASSSLSSDDMLWLGPGAWKGPLLDDGDDEGDD